MQQYGTSMDATETSINSANSAMREQEKYSESLQARLNRMKTAGTELAMVLGDAVLTDSIITVTEAITNMAGAFSSVVGSVGLLAPVLGTAATAVMFFSKKLRENIITTANAKGAWAGATSALNMFKMSLRGLASMTIVGAVFAGIGIAIEKVTAAIGANIRKQEELEEQSKQANKSIKSEESTIRDLVSRYEELSSMNRDNEQEEEYVQLQNELARLLPTVKVAEDEKGNSIIANGDAIKRELDYRKELIDLERQEARAEAPETITSNMNNIEKEEQQLKDLKDELDGYYEKLDRGVGQNFTGRGESVDGLKDKIASTKGEIESTRTSLNEMLYESQDAFTVLASSFEGLSNSEAKWVGQLAKDTNMSMNAFNDFQEQIESVKSSLGEGFDISGFSVSQIEEINSIVGSMDGVKQGSDEWEEYKDRLEEANVSGDMAQNVLMVLSGEMDKFAQSTDNAGDSVYNLEERLKQVNEQYSNATTAIRDVNGFMEEYAKHGEFSTSTMDQIIQKYPELIQYMGNEGELYDKLKEKRAEDVDSANEAMVAKLENSESFYKNGLNQLEEYTSGLADGYQIDLDNYKTLEEAKIGVTQQIIGALSKAWANFHKNQANNLRIDAGKINTSVDDAYLSEGLNNARKKAEEQARQWRNAADQAYNLDDISVNFDELGTDMEDFSAREQEAKESTEELGESTDDMGDSMDEASIHTQEYEDTIRDLDAAIKALNDEQSVYPQWSKKYQDSLKQEIKLLKEKQGIVEDERTSLGQRVADGDFAGTDSGGGSSSSSGGGSQYQNKSASYYVNKDITKQTQLTAEQINGWLSEKIGNRSSAMKGQGEAFVKAAKESGLDPLYLVAHAALETGWGTSSIAKDKKNFFGIGAFDGSAYESAYDFDGNTAGIVEGAKWIAKNYPNGQYGQDTLKKMRFNDGKHQYATDPNWANKIASTMANAFIATTNDTGGGGGGNAGQGASTYLVKAGDTLSEIGQKLGVAWRDIQKVNNNIDPAKLQVGQRLNIPGGGSSSSGGYSGDAFNPAKHYIDNYPVTSDFGWRKDPFTGEREYHSAVDMSKPGEQDRGDPYYAIDGGKVTTSKYSDSAGWYVAVTDTDGNVTRYLHMNKKPKVSVGEEVQAGQQLGEIGTSGNSTGSHIHLDRTSASGTRVNPLTWMKNLAKQGNYAGSSSSSSNSSSGRPNNENQAEDELINLDTIMSGIGAEIEGLEIEVVEAFNARMEHLRSRNDDEIKELEYEQSQVPEHSEEYRNLQKEIDQFKKDDLKSLQNQIAELHEERKRDIYSETQSKQIELMIEDAEEEMYSIQEELDSSLYGLVESMSDSFAHSRGRNDDEFAELEHYLNEYDQESQQYRDIKRKQQEMLQSDRESLEAQIEWLHGERKKIDKYTDSQITDITSSIEGLEEELYGVVDDIDSISQEIITSKVDENLNFISDRLSEFSNAVDYSDSKLQNITEGTKEWNKELQYQQGVLEDQKFYLRGVYENLASLLLDTEKGTEAYKKYKDQLLDVVMSLEDTEAALSDLSQTQKEYNEELYDERQEVADETIDALKGVYEQEIEIIEAQRDKKKEVLDDELDDYNNYIDERLEAMERGRSEDSYEEDRNELEKEQSDLEKRISILSLSNAESDIAERLRLEEELSNKKEEIADLDDERDYNLQRQHYEDMKEQRQEDVQDEKDALDEKAQEDIDFIQERLNNERYWADIREDIVNENWDKVEQITQDTLSRISDYNKDELEKMELSWQNFKNTIDDVQESIGSVDQQQNKDGVYYQGQRYDFSEIDNPNFDKREMTIIVDGEEMSYDDYASDILGGRKNPIYQEQRDAVDTSQDGVWYQGEYRGSVDDPDLPSSVDKKSATFVVDGEKLSYDDYAAKVLGEAQNERRQGYKEPVDATKDGLWYKGEYVGTKNNHDLPSNFNSDYLYVTQGGKILSYDEYAKSIASMDTGGYTGTWGDKGKLAMLHEKELVLDQQDTSNILSAVDITRGMIGKIKDMSKMVAANLNPSAASSDNSINVYINEVHGTDETAADNLANKAISKIRRKGGGI